MLRGTYRSLPLETARLTLKYLFYSHLLTRGLTRGMFIGEHQAKFDRHKFDFIVITHIFVHLVS
jgi:hypothetical protein